VIVHLYGPDSYRRLEKLRALVAEYRAKYPAADVPTYDLEEDPEAWKSAREFLQQPSMFSDTRAAVVRESGAADEKPWRDFLKTLIAPKNPVLFLSDTDAPKKNFSFLAGDAVWHQEFGELSGRTLETFLKKEADAKGVMFGPAAWHAFFEAVGADPEPSWRGIRELEKLSFSGFPKPLSREHVEAVVVSNVRAEVPDLVRRFARAARGERLALLEEALVGRDAAPYFFNSLAYQVRGMDLVQLADYDIAVKSGKLEYEEALLDFVLSH